MNHFFHKPHPFIFNRSSLLIPFVITFLVVLIFRPFELSEFSIYAVLPWAFAFGMVAAACVWLVVKSLQYFFPRALQEDQWTIGKEILLILTVLLSIMLVVFTFLFVHNPEVNHWKLLGSVLIRTFLISLFPVLTLVLYEQYHYQKVKRKEAQQLNQTLQRQTFHTQNTAVTEPSETAVPEKIHLTAENQKVALSIDPAQLIFIRSEGNYVEVFYLRNHALYKELIRAKLTAMEEQLPESEFFRCHKSFLVNVQHILKVEGNARNLELVLDHSEEKIPVSRRKSSELTQLLQRQA